jgi:hypothetical protein
VQALERQLEARARVTDRQMFDPHLARAAADCLAKWREFAGETGEARRAALTAGGALEAAAAQASGLTAIAWLSELTARYRQLGDEDGVARVERGIRERAEDAQGEMHRISVPLNITPEQVATWADTVAGENLETGLWGFAAAGLVGRNASERAVLQLAEQSPLIAHIPIIITGRDAPWRRSVRPMRIPMDGPSTTRRSCCRSEGRLLKIRLCSGPIPAEPVPQGPAHRIPVGFVRSQFDGFLRRRQGLLFPSGAIGSW